LLNFTAAALAGIIPAVLTPRPSRPDNFRKDLRFIDPLRQDKSSILFMIFLHFEIYSFLPRCMGVDNIFIPSHRRSKPFLS
jgi:hypothetical protein